VDVGVDMAGKKKKTFRSMIEDALRKRGNREKTVGPMKAMGGKK